jgi:hypothetical protein
MIIGSPGSLSETIVVFDGTLAGCPADAALESDRV